LLFCFVCRCYCCHFAQDTWCCNSYTRGAPFLIFAGPKPADPAGSIQPLISAGTPLEKNGPRGPARGKGQRGTAGGTTAWPAGLPRPPHLVAGTPRCPPRPGRRKNGPEWPLGAVPPNRIA
jgi:hypothetical protein